MERKNDEEGEIKDLIVEKKKKRMTKNLTRKKVGKRYGVLRSTN